MNDFQWRVWTSIYNQCKSDYCATEQTIKLDTGFTVDQIKKDVKYLVRRNRITVNEEGDIHPKDGKLIYSFGGWL